jgi:hypothetical protein
MRTGRATVSATAPFCYCWNREHQDSKQVNAVPHCDLLHDSGKFGTQSCCCPVEGNLAEARQFGSGDRALCRCYAECSPPRSGGVRCRCDGRLTT